MRRMRSLAVAVAISAFMAGPAVDTADAQIAWTVDALVGSSFANIGTTFAAAGSARIRLNDYVSVVGELGVLPWAPYEDAEGIQAPMPTLVANPDRRVDVYHFNANAQVDVFGRGRGPGGDRWRPYVTVGMGGFIADSVASGTLGETDVKTSRSQTDLATNLGGGVFYRLIDWMDINGDFRTFYLHREGETPRVYRLTAGVSVLLKR